MAHCQQYWEIAKRNSAIFDQIREEKETATGGKVGDALRAREDQYKAVLRQLDQHAADCPVCKAWESD